MTWMLATVTKDRVQEAIRSRHRAGESVEALATDYGMPVEEIQEVVTMSEPTGMTLYEIDKYPGIKFMLYAYHERVVEELTGALTASNVTTEYYKAEAEVQRMREMSDAYARGDNRRAVLLAEIERLVKRVDELTNERDEWHQRWEACLQRQEEEFLSMLARVEETAALKQQLATVTTQRDDALKVQLAALEKESRATQLREARLRERLATAEAERDKFERFNKETIADLCLVSDVLDKAGIPSSDGYGCYSEDQRVEMLVQRYTWTTERPTAPGWYWWRNTQLKYEDDQGPFIYFVRDYVGKMSISNCDIQNSHYDKGEWAGPIEAPLRSCV